MLVVVVDYGMGNLASVARALKYCGGSVVVAEQPDVLTRASGIVLPGVGAFRVGMENLRAAGWKSALDEVVENKSVPLLGICLGMQLLADSGEEGEHCEGLGYVPGRILRLEAVGAGVRVPHVGWNEAKQRRGSRLFDGIPDAADFYFVHSYHFVAEDGEDVLTTTPYGRDFVSAVNRAEVYGVQFHPEKSSRWGFQLLRNFLTMTSSRT